MVKDLYLETTSMLEKMHRMFIEITKDELDKSGFSDVSGIQGLMMYNIAESKITVSEISSRGYYLGSNVTYNLKKLVEADYVKQTVSPHDKRAMYIHLSAKGKKVLKIIDNMLKQHVDNFNTNGIAENKLRETNQTLKKINSFWQILALSNGHNF